MKKIYIIVAILAATLSNGYGQYIPISMEQKLENTIHIVEGEVVDQICFRGEDGDVYTENTIRVEKVLRGSLKEEFVSIITMGGSLDDETITWTHVLSLEIGDKGAFFLRESIFPLNQNSSITQFSVYSGVQGFYGYYGEEEDLSVSAVLSKFGGKQSFYQALGLVHDAKRALHERRSVEFEDGDCIVYEIEMVTPSDYAGKSGVVDFNVFVSYEGTPKRLYESEIFLRYSPDWFDYNIVDNGKIQMELKGEFQTNYEISLEDIENNLLKISLNGKERLFGSLLEIGEEAQYLATISLNIIGVSEDEPLESDYSSDIIRNIYLDEQGREGHFDCMEVEVGRGGCKPIIKTVTTEHASGIGDFIIITGEDFIHEDVEEKDEWCGLPNREHKVLFQSVGGGQISPFPKDYIIWTDNEIRVMVPSLGTKDFSNNLTSFIKDDQAGTGHISICTKLKNKKKCKCGRSTFKKEDKLYVPFSSINSNHMNDNCEFSYESRLRNQSGNGGYEMSFSKSFKDNFGTAGQNAFIRAMNDWRCAINFNWEVKVSGGIPITAGKLADGINSSGQIIATAGKTTIIPNHCDNEKSQIQFIKMIFNINLNWNFEEKKKLSKIHFSSVARHELGHSIGLLHTSNEKNVMKAGKSGSENWILTADDIKGGSHKVGTGQENMPNSCLPAVITIQGNCQQGYVSTSNINKLEENIFKYLHEKEEILFKPKNINIFIYNLNGILILKRSLKYTNIKISVSDLPNGLYFIIIENEENKVQTFKFLKL